VAKNKLAIFEKLMKNYGYQNSEILKWKRTEKIDNGLKKSDLKKWRKKRRKVNETKIIKMWRKYFSEKWAFDIQTKIYNECI
jgi:hypothetical protein